MNRQLPPLAAGEDMLLLQNPDRGFRMGVEVDIRGESGVPMPTPDGKSAGKAIKCGPMTSP
ncbi:MAG: hypothetical protein ACLU9S_01790 [Oscillospiraceae bacterium]